MIGLKTGAAARLMFRTFSSLHKPLVVRSLSNASFSFSPLSSSDIPVKRKSVFSSWNSPSSSSTALKTFNFQRHYSAKSLAEEVLKAKTAMDKSSENEKAGSEEDKSADGTEPPKGPKPLTKWQKMGYAFFGLALINGVVMGAIIFCLPDKDENGNTIEDDFSQLPFPSQYYARLKSRVFKTKKDLEDPFSDKLLPDPMTEPYYQPKYTVLIELTGLLVHSNWTHKHGWRFQKRPAVDMFLSQVGYPNFELVIFTTENGMTFDPIVNGLDPELQHIMYRLYRDATRYVNGHHTKDLSALNRDLKKVILVDWNSNSVALNRDNSLILKKWEGDNTDRQLIGLAQLLQAIRQSDVDDVREVLEFYRQFDDPIEAFRENQRKLQEEMHALEEKQKEMQTRATSLFSKFRSFGRS